MKILAIRIKNLASLEDLTEIDFTQEPLCSAGIFAITGPTGAGKSTILDALCLALYAKTPRYKQAESGIEIHDVQGSTISQSDARGILRDGTAEGFAEVDFAGVDGQHYRATWSVRRARNKAEGSLQAFTVALKNIRTNADIPGKKTELLDEIERLVGLNFEQFTRSVLLAQGDFTAFLKAGKDEKSSLLEKLTGTHIYSEISKNVFEKHKEEAQELRDLNLQREGIATLTAEELDALGVQKAALGISIEALQKQIDALAKEIVWHEQLSVLQSSLSIANSASEQAIVIKESALPRELKLKQVEQVQPARTWIDGLHTIKEQTAHKTATVQQLHEALLDLQQQETAMELVVKNAATELASKSKASEDAAPLLNEARALDVQVKERAEQVKKAAEEVQRARESSKQQEQQLQEQQQLSDKLQSSITQLKQWKEEHGSRQPVADNESLIVSKLSDAGKLLDTLQAGSLQLKKAQESIATKGLEKTGLEKQLAAIQATSTASRQTYDATLTALSAVAIAELERDKTRTDSMVEEIIAAEGHWKILYHALKEHAAITGTLIANKKAFDNKQEELRKTVEQLGIARTQRETSLLLVERARLAAAENMETLRSQLVDGDPCPVCGSTTHPYSIHNPQLDHVLAALEATYQQHETAYTGYLTAKSSLQEASLQLQKMISTQETDLVSKTAVLQGLQETWSGFAIHQDCANLPDEQNAGWLQQQLQEKRTAQKNLQGKIQSYYAQKQQLESQKDQLVHAEKQLADTDNAIKDTARNLQSLQEQIEQHTQEQEKINTGLAAVEQLLSPWFRAEDWFGQWKKSPGMFVKRIAGFAEEWKAKTFQLEADLKQQDVLSATVKGMQEQLVRLVEEANKKEGILLGLKDQHHELERKRKSIFAGEIVATIEANFKQAIEIARQTLEKHKADKEKLHIAIARTGTQKEQTEKEIIVLQEQANGFTKSLQQWLLGYHVKYAAALQESELAGLLSLTPEWMEGERTALRAIDDAVTQTQSVLAERKALLEKHEQQRLSEQSLDESKLSQTDTKAAWQKAVQENNDIDFRIRQDKENKQQIGDLLRTVEAKAQIVENWAKLNEIIGSADGKKFRQIAQEYTLDILLSYANIHLEMLSKRYLLQRIPHSLGLQVLDQDMGEEIRTVFSLSGGESFLVSLALALGLASLSSSRMKVESLFIDEGFGSLDPTTLNIAMDALERLHNQGRKVGVISHVQEMTERIPVQIKVSKQHTGRSMVEIVA